MLEEATRKHCTIAGSQDISDPFVFTSNERRKCHPEITKHELPIRDGSSIEELFTGYEIDALYT